MKLNPALLGADRPRTVYLLVAALTVLMGLMIPSIQIDTDPENMLSADQADRAFHNRVKTEFALHDAIVVGVVKDERDDETGAGIYNPQTLSAIHALTEGIIAIDGVVRDDLMSLSSVDNIEQAGPGTVRFSWLMAEPPADAIEAEAVRSRVERLPLLMNTLVSDDGQATAIYVPIESKDQSYRISAEIEALIDQLPQAAREGNDFHITGLPVAEDTFGFEMFVQMGISAPLAAIVIFLLMWVFFGNLKLVISPMIVAMATVIITMGLLIGMGYTVHIMSSMIPIFLMPIAVVDSIHIMSEFADRYRPGLRRGEVITEVVNELFRPMLFTSITSAVGFLSLALTPIPPVQVFGVFVAIGILLAFVLTILFIPAYVSRMSESSLASLQQIHHGEDTRGVIAEGVRRAGSLAMRWPRALLLLALAVIAVSVLGIERIQINDNPVRWFKSSHRIRVADEVLNEHFAGTYDAFFVLEHQLDEDLVVAELQTALQELGAVGEAAAAIKAAEGLITDSDASLTQRLDQALAVLDDALWQVPFEQAGTLDNAIALLDESRARLGYFLQPDALGLIEGIQQAMADSGLVGKSNALPDLVKTINRELRSGSAADYRLPESRAGVAQALLQFQSSHRPQDLWRMVTPDHERTVIWLQLTSGDNQDMTAVIAALDNYLADHPLPAELSGNWAGKAYINVVWQDAMVAGMVKSLMGAFVFVLVMMAVLFRSLLFGLVAMLPLSITIAFIYGLIGWLGKDYDMPIAVLSALTLGLSVDFAIHFLERSRAVHRETGDFAATMRAMFEEPGRAITRNAVVIAVGFLPLLFAPLVPYITVGFFLATIMAVSGGVTMLLLPAVGAMLRRWMYPESHTDTPSPI